MSIRACAQVQAWLTAFKKKKFLPVYLHAEQAGWQQHARLAEVVEERHELPAWAHQLEMSAMTAETSSCLQLHLPCRSGCFLSLACWGAQRMMCHRILPRIWGQHLASFWHQCWKACCLPGWPMIPDSADENSCLQLTLDLIQ